MMFWYKFDFMNRDTISRIVIDLTPGNSYTMYPGINESTSLISKNIYTNNITCITSVMIGFSKQLTSSLYY